MAETNPIRVKTGMYGLDDLLDGGLEKNRTYLVAGESGTGKTVFALQFIYAGLQEGENGVYVAVHESPQDLMDDAKSFGWDLEPYLQKKNLVILDISPYISKVNEGESLNVRQLVVELTKHIRENHAQRLVIDSIDFIARHATKSERETKEYLRSILQSVTATLDCTTLITSPVPAGTKNLSPSGVEEFLVSGIFVLGVDSEGTDRVMQIKKMRQTNIGISKYRYYIDPRRGISVTDW